MRHTFRQRPNSGGWWEWYHGAETAAACADTKVEMLLLCTRGAEVVDDDEWSRVTGRVPDDAGTVGNYWEGEATDLMPGMWRKASRRAVARHIAEIPLPLLREAGK